MTILMLLIPLSITVGAIWLIAFFIALRAGQFEDPQGNAARILQDRDPD